MPNLFRHPTYKVCSMAVNLSRGILKQVQDDSLRRRRREGDQA
jgi:hypothetical protein